MSSNAIRAQGTLLQIGDGGSPENFTTVAEVLDLEGPALATSTIDVTHQSSPGDYDEWIAGPKTGGNVTFEVNYNPQDGTHNASTGILADFVSGVRRNWRMLFPDTPATQWSFAAIVETVRPIAQIRGQLRLAISLKVSGQPTLA